MTHVVALSGGKDSTAMALRLAEIEPRDYEYICTPTSNEPDEMFDHWRRLGALLGKRITPVIGGTLEGIIREENMIPNVWTRFCTRRLKIAPYAAWLARHTPAMSYVGLRADEELRVGGDYIAVDGVTSRYPLREWNWKLGDVVRYLNDRGVVIPDRTDCQLCFFQRLDEWWALWRDKPDEWAKGEDIEARTGHTFRSPGRDTWPAAMKDLRREFEQGHRPKRAGQMDLFKSLQCRVCRQ